MTMIYNDDDVLRYMYNYLLYVPVVLLPYYYTCSVQNPRGLEKVTTSIPKFYMYLLYDTYQQRLKEKGVRDLVRGEGSRYICTRYLEVGCRICCY